MLGPKSSPTVAIGLNNLAELYRDQGRPKQAITVLYTRRHLASTKPFHSPPPFSQRSPLHSAWNCSRKPSMKRVR